VTPPDPAARDVRANEERLRLALEAARMGTWDWDLTSDRQVISTETEALFGFAPGAFTGDLDQLLASIHPEDRPLVREAAEQALDGGELRLEHRVVWPDGTVHWLETRGRVLRDSTGKPLRLLGVVRDVTDSKRMALALQREREFSQRLIESSGDGIMAFDLAYRYTVWNPAMERITGLARQAVLGRSAFEVFPFLREIGQDRFFDQALAGETVVTTDRPYRVPETGRAGFFESQYAPIRDEAGAIIGGLGVIHDITARKQAEAELRSEHAARAAAEAGVRERDQVLATVSHDLKTPLTTIASYAKLLRRQAMRDGALEFERASPGLEAIESAVARMTAWINELLDAAHLQAGRPLDLRREPTDLLALARQVAAEQQQETDRHTIRLLTDEGNLIGDWDPARLSRVLQNLVSNAVKFSPAGGEITLQLERESDAHGSWAVVRVRDQGLGIPDADQAHIFERFHRGTNVVGRIPGTGIGLAGARFIVERHGGTIAVDSREDQGTTFTVRLPLAPLEQAPAAAATEMVEPRAIARPTSGTAETAARMPPE
jgi:PAS domain S-box-containing protein